MKKALFTFVILALLTSIYIFYPDSSSQSSESVRPTEEATAQLIKEQPLINRIAASEKKDIAVFLLNISVDIGLDLLQGKDVTKKNEAKQSFYMFAHRKSDTNEWRMAIQPLGKFNDVLTDVPLSYIDVEWNDNHLIQDIDLLKMDKKHPNSKVADVLWQFSFLEASQKEIIIPFSGENLKYSYKKNHNFVSRVLKEFDKERYEMISDSWKLTQKNNEVLIGIDQVKFNLDFKSKSDGKAKINLSFNLLVQNISDTYKGSLPNFKLGEKSPNIDFNLYAKQKRSELEPDIIIANRDDVIQRIRDFSTNFDADMLKKVGEYILGMDYEDLKLLLDVEGYSDKEQSYLVHAIELVGGKDANALLVKLMEDPNLTVANRYRAMISLANLPAQTLNNFNSVKSLALIQDNIDSGLKHNAAIQMVNIANKMDSSVLSLSKEALEDYMNQDGSHREAYLLALAQLQSPDGYLTILGDLDSSSTLSRTAAAQVLVNSALLNVTDAINLVKQNYISETDAQVLNRYNELIKKSGLDSDFSEQIYEVIAKTKQMEERKIRLEALTHNSNSCVQHQEFLSAYLGSVNVHPVNVAMVKKRCSNLG